MTPRPPLTKLVKRVPRQPAESKPMSPETWDLRQQVLRKYGGICACPCGCRCDNLRLLQLHHVDGEGTKDRKTTRGINLYTRLMAQPVDSTLHPLCVSCHWQITIFGNCDQDLTGGGKEKEEPQHNGGEEPVVTQHDQSPPAPDFDYLRNAGRTAAERGIPQSLPEPLPRQWRRWPWRR